MIQGECTARAASPSTSTSQGDEAGNQGGNVVTHKTKGRGYFIVWSLDVKIEGKGACRNDDPIDQNCGSKPRGAATSRARVNYVYGRVKSCPRPYDRHNALICNPRFS